MANSAVDESDMVDRALLVAAVSGRLRDAGYHPAAAELTAEHLVRAEAEGYRSHGLLLLPTYVKEVAAEAVAPDAAVELTHDEGATLVFDGHHSPGHAALATAIDTGIERAHRYRTATLWVSQLRHTGRLADYVWQAVERGVTALLTVATALDVRSALVAPPGAADRLLGSNPLAIGVTDGSTTQVVYDGSTAAIPFYELLRRHEAGEPLGEAAVVDASGRPSTDPAAFFDGGAIRAAGGPRGFGLSTTLALLAQLRCGPVHGGAANAFAMLVAGGDAGAIGETAAALERAGAYLPGSRRAARVADPQVAVPASTLRALLDIGVRLCDR